LRHNNGLPAILSLKFELAQIIEETLPQSQKAQSKHKEQEGFHKAFIYLASLLRGKKYLSA
jgi:hypothetical protein